MLVTVLDLLPAGDVGLNSSSETVCLCCCHQQHFFLAERPSVLVFYSLVIFSFLYVFYFLCIRKRVVLQKMAYFRSAVVVVYIVRGKPLTHSIKYEIVFVKVNVKRRRPYMF